MEKLNYQLLKPDFIKRLGLIVLQTDETIEDEMRFYFKDQTISLLLSRIPFESEVNAATLKQMESYLGQSMSLFPLEAEFDAFAYACTSGAMQIGSKKIAALVSETRLCHYVTDPLNSAIAALKSINVNNIVFLAPYSKKVSTSMMDFLSNKNIKIVSSAIYDEPLDNYVARISPQTIQRDAIKLVQNNPDVDAIFIPCTNLKCAHIIPQIEAQTNIPTISSNQVLAWDLARQIGLRLGADKGLLCQ